MTAESALILLPDFGIGNLASIVNMVSKCGGRTQIVTDPRNLRQEGKLILAGVGSFDAAARVMREGGWVYALEDAVKVRRMPCLGVCLGMQLMCFGSEEGKLPGLGWIDAEVKRFSIPEGSSLKVPHMGWNTVDVEKPNPLISTTSGEQRFYFVHSYYVACRHSTDVVATAQHGIKFDAAFSRENIFGVQFHPEKSHRFGMMLIQKFLEQ